METTLHVSREPEKLLAERLVLLLNEPGHKHVALSGGNTPRPLYELLGSDYAGLIPWAKLSLYQVDEREVPPDRPDSNYRMIRETLLKHIDDVTFERMEAERIGAADDYERLLAVTLPQNEKHRPIFDAVLLGMGEDGHTASLFPGTPGLQEKRRFVLRNPSLDGGRHRLTLTFPVLNAARNRWFLVRGKEKAAALRRVLAGKLPASHVREPEWFVGAELFADAADGSGAE